jgi:hypothetical protein
MNNNDLSDLNRVKTAEEYLKEKNITPETKHHNYDYVYHSVLGAIEQAQKDAFKEGQSSPKIKQLEWNGKEESAFFTAQTNIGEYMIDSPHNDGIFVLMYTSDWSDESFVLHTSDSVDELKCFAQQDFEERVMECLE